MWDHGELFNLLRYLPFNKTDTGLTYLDLLIISEENCSFDLNAMEAFYECLSLAGQYCPLSHQQGISLILVLNVTFGVFAYLFVSHNEIYAQICSKFNQQCLKLDFGALKL